MKRTRTILAAICLLLQMNIYVLASEKPTTIFRLESNLSGYSSGRVSANPKFKWRKQLPAAISAVPVISGEHILVSCSNRMVYCIKADGSETIWEYKLSSEAEASITVYDDTAIACTTDNKVVALAVDNGNLRWEKILGGKLAGAANIYREEAGVRILLGSYDNNIYCLDFANGEILWQIKADNYINSSVSIAGKIAAVGSCDGNMYFADISSGKIAGKFDTGAYIPGWPVVCEKTCYCGNYNGDFFAINTEDYTQKWKYSIEGESINKGATVSDSSVLFPDENGTLYCLNREDGKERWKFKPDGKGLSAPLLAGDSVFCSSENGWIYMLNLADGKIRWKYLVGESMTLGVYLTKDSLIFPDDSGRIYCFELVREK